MPSEEIMPLFKAGQLHSGRSGKVVTDNKQAQAIRMSYMRKEGKLPAKAKKTLGQRLVG